MVDQTSQSDSQGREGGEERLHRPPSPAQPAPRTESDSTLPEQPQQQQQQQHHHHHPDQEQEQEQENQQQEKQQHPNQEQVEQRQVQPHPQEEGPSEEEKSSSHPGHISDPSSHIQIQVQEELLQPPLPHLSQQRFDLAPQSKFSSSHQPTRSTHLESLTSLPPSGSIKMSRNRLPTLQEVLARQTRPPVDLYCFYLYLQRERAEDSLDFWLDAQQHENLCRAYFKDLRRSAVDLRNEWPAYYQRARTRGSVYNPINGISRQNGNLNELSEKSARPQSIDSSHLSQLAGQQNSGLPSPMPPHVSPALRALFAHDKLPNQDLDHPPAKRSSHRAPIQPIIPRSSAITRTDLIASAERIYYRYLLSGAEKEIYLPSNLRIHNFPINSASLPHAGTPDGEYEASFMAMIPDLFVSQKEYIYRSMERDTFPRFLRAKAFGNLTPLSNLIRLILGLFALWVGLSIGFSLIFLDVHPRGHRLWSAIPLTIGAIGIIGHFYELDPVLMLLNRSETTFFRTLSVKEKYVQKILRGRALWVLFLSFMIVTIITCILVFVPGHRL